MSAYAYTKKYINDIVMNGDCERLESNKRGGEERTRVWERILLEEGRYELNQTQKREPSAIEEMHFGPEGYKRENTRVTMPSSLRSAVSKSCSMSTSLRWEVRDIGKKWSTLVIHLLDIQAISPALFLFLISFFLSFSLYIWKEFLFLLHTIL